MNQRPCGGISRPGEMAVKLGWTFSRARSQPRDEDRSRPDQGAAAA